MAADAIHGHHPQERTTALAVGRPGDWTLWTGQASRVRRSPPATTSSGQTMNGPIGVEPFH